jgi:hypothetical protein
MWQRTVPLLERYCRRIIRTGQNGNLRPDPCEPERALVSPVESIESSGLKGDDMAEVTTDHDAIRRWAGKHGGKPAAVRATHRDKDIGIVRIMFPKAPQSEHEGLEEISWEAFFKEFDSRGLALLYEEDSMFSKLVSRESVGESERGGRKTRRKANVET